MSRRLQGPERRGRLLVRDARLTLCIFRASRAVSRYAPSHAHDRTAYAHLDAYART